jgi:hypothetical protein
MGQATGSAVSSASGSSTGAPVDTAVQLPTERGAGGEGFERHHTQAPCPNRARAPCPTRLSLKLSSGC